MGRISYIIGQISDINCGMNDIFWRHLLSPAENGVKVALNVTYHPWKVYGHDQSPI